MHEALYNWGAALGELAQLTNDAALFEEAISKFEAALAIKPDDHEALNNWGAALGNLAELKKNEALYDEAISKYKAGRSSPMIIQCWSIWDLFLENWRSYPRGTLCK